MPAYLLRQHRLMQHGSSITAPVSLQINLPSSVATHFVNDRLVSPVLDFEVAATANVAAATAATIAKAIFAFIISFTSLSLFIGATLQL